MDDRTIAVKIINSLHIAWIYVEPNSREQYNLEGDIGYYHAGSDREEVSRIEREFVKLGVLPEKDYSIQDTVFDGVHIYTICLKEKAGKLLEQLGIRLTPNA